MITNSPEAQPEEGELLPRCPFCNQAPEPFQRMIQREPPLHKAVAICQTRGCALYQRFIDVDKWSVRADLPRATADDDEHAEAVTRQIVNILNAAHPSIDWPFWTIRNLIAAEFAPRTTGETTVGAALAELHRRHPDNCVELSVDAGGWWLLTRVNTDGIIFTLGEGESVNDCMAQVRAATRTD